MPKYKCDQCDAWVENITKQFIKKRIRNNAKLTYQTCDDCSEAIVKQADKFAKEEKERQIRAANVRWLSTAGSEIGKVLATVLSPVIYASDCETCSLCEEPFCLRCFNHYADCTCIGPDEEDVWYSDCGSFGFRVPEELQI